MIRSFVIACALALLASAAVAEEAAKPLTVEQCIGVANGLGALNWAGQTLGQPGNAQPADSKHYKLGAALMTIAEDIDALKDVQNEALRSQQAFAASLPALPPPPEGKPDPNAAERVDQTKKMNDNWSTMMAQPCHVTVAHLKLSDLRIGDDADHNSIPPSVLAALVPIIDGK